MDILNEANISEGSKIASTDERKHMMFVFLNMGYITQNDYFQIHLFIWGFHFS